MNDFPTAYLLGVERTRREAMSAYPDAPVVPDRARPQRRTARVRTVSRARLAGVLRVAADAISPSTGDPAALHRAESSICTG